MHYLLITSEFPPGPGGIGKHAFCLAKGLLHNGVKVSVVCNMDHDTEEEIHKFISEAPHGLEIHRIKRDGYKTYTQRINKVMELCRQNNFDKVIVSGQFSLWIGWLLKRQFGSKIIVDGFVHGSELLLGGKIKTLFTQVSLYAVDNIWAVSNYTAGLIKQKVHNRNVQVIVNGLDLEEWNEIEPIIPFEWKGYPKLLTVGSITQRKGQHNIVNALPALLKQYPALHYHIVGLPAGQEELMELATRLGVAEYVTIHGTLSQHNLKRAFKSADIFCMLSEQTSAGDVEGFGIAILEANINGLPAIGSNHGGIPDAIKNGFNGYVINAYSADELQTAVDKILSSDRIQLRHNSVSWAMAHNWSVLVKQLL